MINHFERLMAHPPDGRRCGPQPGGQFRQPGGSASSSGTRIPLRPTNCVHCCPSIYLDLNRERSPPSTRLMGCVRLICGL